MRALLLLCIRAQGVLAREETERDRSEGRVEMEEGPQQNEVALRGEGAGGARAGRHLRNHRVICTDFPESSCGAAGHD